MNDVGQSLAAAEIQSGSLSRRGVNMQFALLVLALGGVVWGSGAQTGCSDCQLASCPAVLCRVPELLAEDECGCCKRCLGVQGERCGGQGLKHGRCAPGYVCLTSADGPKEDGEREKDEKEESEDEEGTGACVCKHDYPVCGSDTNTYPTICALHLASWVSVHQQEGKIHKTHDGECKYGKGLEGEEVPSKWGEREREVKEVARDRRKEKERKQKEWRRMGRRGEKGGGEGRLGDRTRRCKGKKWGVQEGNGEQGKRRERLKEAGAKWRKQNKGNAKRRTGTIAWNS